MSSRVPVAFALAAFVAVALPRNGPADTVDFARDVQPILAKHCLACHGPDDAEGGLVFTDRESALAEGDSGEFAIVPGDVDASHLIERITADVDANFDRMPPEGDAVSGDEAETLRRWIAEGAKWKRHWAFEPLADPDVTDVLKTSDVSVAGLAAARIHPIDAFVIDRLAEVGLTLNPPADRRTLIRRASYDLIGLPPTPAQIADFVADRDPRAYEKLIDRLLASPHYGERWGRHWLDLVRYAETNSFERDGVKPNAWKYRDYVIRSFNEDKPYDQFVREQLAGDELDRVTPETLTATGFYRLGIWDDEPADPKQAYYDELDDVITTVSQGILGLTVNCARCHDHKIDPIPQTDYYSLLAFFADVTTYGVRSDQTGNNQIDVSPPDVKKSHAEAERTIRALSRSMREIEQAGIATMSAADQRATEGDPKRRRKVLDEKLRDHLETPRWTTYADLKTRLADARAHRDALPARSRVLGLARYPDQLKPTRVLFRGNPHSPTDEVQPAFPTLFDDAPPPIPNARASNRPAGRRRALADWICDNRNRLTARVIANRLWQFHFGRGIVRSSNNFGRLGSPPTHPRLLDYLAQRVIQGDWRLKAMHRLIMTSNTYRQSSIDRNDAVAKDPANDRFWRFDPRRLSAEEVRDSMLAVTGTLNRKLYGPSFFAKLSPEALAGQTNPGEGWGESPADEQNRRSIYIHQKRSLITPMMSAFDFPDPDRTCEARFMTLQPGQALALLNSDFAHSMAARLSDALDADVLHDAELVDRCVMAVLGRTADEDDVRRGVALIGRLQSDYGLPRSRATQLYCLSVMNWNEFLFLD